MRAQGVEVTSAGIDQHPWVDDFYPAIRPVRIDACAPVSVRYPQWFVLRYVAGKERLMRRLLDHIGLPFHHLVYQQRLPRRKSVERSWFPGHFFVEFDIDLDFWQQIHRMPDVLELLGAPTALPEGMMNDLIGRLPYRVEKASPHASVAPGQTVQIVRGPFAGWECVVTWSDRKSVRMMAMMFGGPRELTMAMTDILVLG